MPQIIIVIDLGGVLKIHQQQIEQEARRKMTDLKTLHSQATDELVSKGDPFHIGESCSMGVETTCCPAELGWPVWLNNEREDKENEAPYHNKCNSQYGKVDSRDVQQKPSVHGLLSWEWRANTGRTLVRAVAADQEKIT